MMLNLLMELDSSGIKSTSEIATPLQSASALEELNQKRNLLAAGRGGSTHAGQGRQGLGGNLVCPESSSLALPTHRQ